MVDRLEVRDDDPVDVADDVSDDVTDVEMELV